MKTSKEIKNSLKFLKDNLEKNKLNILPKIKDLKLIDVNLIKRKIFQFENIILSKNKNKYEFLKNNMKNYKKELNYFTSLKFYIKNNFIKQKDIKKEEEIIIEELIIKVFFPELLKKNEEKKLLNFHLKEKINILQCYLKPEIFNLNLQLTNPKIIFLAIKGYLKRIRKN